MRLRDLMSVEPLTVGPDTSRDTLRRMMDAGRIHHMPLIDGDHLVGMWVASDAGPIVLVGPEQIRVVPADADAVDAVRMLLEGGEAVVAVEEGRPVGILTRTDALRIVEDGLAAAERRHAPPPLVLRLIGPAGAGKTTLLLRTLPRLRNCQVGIVEANSRPQDERLPSLVAGASVLYAPEAHWRKGLRDAIGHLGGADLIMVEDRDQAPQLGTGLGEDVQVIVVPVAGADALDAPSLREAQAVVLTKLDEVPAADLDALRERIARENPRTAVFAVGQGEGEHGMGDWYRWLEERLRRHRR